MGAGPAPGELDEAELLAAVRRILAQGRAGAATERRPGQALHEAEVEASRVDERHGHLAGLILFWITGGEASPQRLDVADEILNGDDPRRAKVDVMARRLGTGEITWDEFATVIKKGLIPKARPAVVAPRALAVPLAEAKTALEAALGGKSDLRPEEVWRDFANFARRPVEATPPLVVENDMCLFQWGVYDWGEGPSFECDFTRQFSLRDGDGNYDHMEQLSLTLLLDPGDPDLAGLGSGSIWSESDLPGWIDRVETGDVFCVVMTKVPGGVRLDHSTV